MWGSWNQTSYSGSIHNGILSTGWVPLYCKLKDSHARSPREVESIVWYISVVLENGGSSPRTASDVAHRLSRELISPADI
jgi:hypothetical protein